MTGIRPYREEDGPRIIALRGRVFGRGQLSNGDFVRNAQAYHDALLHNPWRDDDIQSLVYEDRTGRITGFVGVVPRRMDASGRSVRAAVLSSFLVDPEHGSPVVAASLLKRVVDGGQDLSFGNGANDTMRALWEASGRGVVTHLSMRWWRLVRPIAFGAEWLRRRSAPAAAVGSALRFASRVVDTPGLADRRFPTGHRLRQPISSVIRTRPLCGEELLGCIDRFGARRTLRSAYTLEQIDMLLGYLDVRGGRSLITAGVEEGGRLLGWFVGRRAGAVMQVLQLGAFEGRGRDVVGAATDDAYRRGVASIQGRLDASLLGDLWDAGCGLRRGPWFLIDSRDRGLLAEVHSGRALITSLETASLPTDW